MARKHAGQFRKGQSGNPAGRPRGSRNKSSLVKAQLLLDDSSEMSVKLFRALVTRDVAQLAEFGLSPSDVNVKAMMEAAKIILMQSSSEMKALASDKKKEDDVPEQKDDAPTFQNVARIGSK